MANGVEEIISSLYDMIQNAWSLPLGADKCVVERDKVLDLLDEISGQLPAEVKQARTIVDTRNEVIANAKREAENIVKQAEDRAKLLVSDSEIYRNAQLEAQKIVQTAEEKVKELRRATNEYVDNAMRETEESIEQALSDIRNSRSKFNALTGNAQKSESPIIEDV